MTYHVIEANYSDFSQDHTQKNCLIFMFMLVVCDAIYPIQKNQLEKPTVKLFLPLFSHGISSSFFLAPGISAKKMAGSVWLLWRKQISRDFAVATFSVPHRGDWVFLVQHLLFYFDMMQRMMLPLSNLSIGTFGEGIDSLCLEKRLICEKSTFAKIGSAIAVVKPVAA